jgi:transposase-like protein
MSQADAKNFKGQFGQLKVWAQVWLKREQYLTFLKYPEAIRRYIYTTNVSENFHRLLEWLCQHLGGLFQRYWGLTSLVKI